MINRNSGLRGRTRTDEERQPKNEIITSRKRDDSGIVCDKISSSDINVTNESLSEKEEESEDISSAQEVINNVVCNVYIYIYINNL